MLSEECYGNSYKWGVFEKLANATFSSYGFKANATNKFYYDLLKMFDIEVVEMFLNKMLKENIIPKLNINAEIT